MSTLCLNSGAALHSFISTATDLKRRDALDGEADVGGGRGLGEYCLKVVNALFLHLEANKGDWLPARSARSPLKCSVHSCWSATPKSVISPSGTKWNNRTELNFM